MKEKICSMCNKKIEKGEPHFNFPRMPQWHKFIDLSGETFHIDCIKKLDKKRNIGEELAKITEDISSKSDIQPFILRDGNIVVQGRLDEKSIEITDYEDFVEFGISLRNIDMLTEMMPLEIVNNRMTTIRLLQDDKLEIITPFDIVKLEKLNFTRLKKIIGEIDLDIYSDEHLKELNYQYVMGEKKPKRK